MTTSSSDRTAAIARARASVRPEDVVDGIKAIVGDEVRELSPDANLVSTSFFNHTYMPDFVMEWRERGRLTSRPIFIRNHLTPASAPREIEALSEREPVVVGLDPVDDEPTRDAVRTSFTSRPSRMLISDVESIGDLAASVGGGTDAPSPLLTLVRSNILRGGRGLLTGNEVGTVAEAASLDPASPYAAEQLETFTAMAADLFEEASATRLLRAADIIRLALTLDEEQAVITSVQGELADADLRILLPYLLQQQEQITNRQFWAYIGSMMSLARLEEFASSLESVSIEPLVLANLDTWTAKRAQLAFNPQYDEENDDETTARWGIQAGLLAGTIGRYVLSLASDARRLKGRDVREEGLLPRWEDIDRISALYRLDQIDLRGMVRRVRVTAEESGDVARDVRSINATLEDSYNVQQVAVRRIGTQSEEPMLVEFAASLVTGDHPETLEDLSRTALDFLAHRRPVEPGQIASLLGGERRA